LKISSSTAFEPIIGLDKILLSALPIIKNKSELLEFLLGQILSLQQKTDYSGNLKTLIILQTKRSQTENSRTLINKN